MTINSITISGEKAEPKGLPEKVFAVKPNEKMIIQAVRVYLGNQRKANAKVKSRGEIAKTTAKMYRQKGTGRARHGSYSAPIFVGGGVAHGPDGRQNFTGKLTKKMRRVALLSTLSDKAKNGLVVTLVGADKATGKTKEALKMAKKAGLGIKYSVVGTKEQTKWRQSFKNIEGVGVYMPRELNPYLILKHRKLLISNEAVKEIANEYSN